MRIRRMIAVWTAKSAEFVSRNIFHRQGVTWAGKLALMICPTILKELSGQVQKGIYMVCGTNGKTTTNNLLCQALEAEGYRVVCNHTGSNMLNGVVASFVLAADWKGDLHVDYACMEVDEASTRLVLPHVKPDYMVLTNLFRDQLDRYGEIDITMDILKKAMQSAPKMKVIVNGDDALSAYLAMESGNPFVTFGISEKVMEDKDSHEIREGRFCKCCGAPLHYRFYHFSQLGDYACTKCGFKRPAIDFDATKVSVSDHLEFSVDGKQILANYKGFYNIYNILACYAAMRTGGVEPAHMQKMLKEFHPENGRMEEFHINGTNVVLNLAKNPAGFNQNISAVIQDEGLKDLIVVINDNAQDGTDISWLWDVDFDRFKAAHVNSITVSGLRCYDMRLRLKYVNIPSRLDPDVESAIVERLEHGCGDLYVLVNYTALFSTRNILKKLEAKGNSAEAAQCEGSKNPSINESGENEPSEVQKKTEGEAHNKSVGEAKKGTGQKLKIGHLYPDLLNLYGDRGNIACLMERCLWRGIQAETVEINSGDKIDFSDLDIILLGGGSDREQAIVCKYLLEIKEEFKAYVEDGGVVIAVCGGYQLLGNYYQTEGTRIEGLGIIDLYTIQGEGRLIDNIVLKSEICEMPVVGFENHGGRTYLNGNQPFGKVFYGNGNDDESGYEGVIYKNVIGTYLHGPLLPKNPQVADWLITKALERKYGSVELGKLPDQEEKEANTCMYERLVK